MARIANLNDVTLTDTMVWRIHLPAFQVAVVLFWMIQEICGYFAVVVSFVLQTFWRRNISEVVITRKPSLARQMRLANPHSVVTFCIFVRALKPLFIFVTGGLLRFVNAKNHGSQKGRLRAAQVVTAVSIQDASVVFNFKKEILDHAFGKFDLSILQEPAHDEITVPSVHLIESAARHDVFVFEVEQSLRTKRRRIDLPRSGNFLW